MNTSYTLTVNLSAPLKYNSTNKWEREDIWETASVCLKYIELISATGEWSQSNSCSPFPAAESGSKGRFTPHANTAYSSKAPLISARLLLIFSHLREENRSLCDSVAAKHAPPGSGHCSQHSETLSSCFWHQCGSLQGHHLMFPGKSKAGGCTISCEVLGIAVQRIKLWSHSRSVFS